MSETQKHTQGPLEAAFCPRGYNEPHSVAIVGPLPGRLIVAKVFGTEAQALADGRLFAASPDLLEALENLEVEASQEIDPNTSLNIAINEARLAIAKATGEAI